MDRLLNAIALFLVILLFILEGTTTDHIRILLAFVLSLLLSMTAFLWGWFSLDGFYAAVVTGTALLGLGGWITALLVLLFFISSNLITRSIPAGNPVTGNEIRRDGLQVWANGFWMVLFAILLFLFQSELFQLLIAVAIASVTSDTWATEVGSRRGGKTLLISRLIEVPPGTDGGVSFHGTLFALLGALLIAAAYLAFSFQASLFNFFLVLFCGFSGCIADSYLGAVYQTGQRYRYSRIFRYARSRREQNHLVNWAATGIACIIALLIIQLA